MTEWETHCDECGDELAQTSIDERECPRCNFLYPDMSSEFWQEMLRKVMDRT